MGRPLADGDVKRSHARRDRRGQRPLDADDEVAQGVQRLLRQVVLLAVEFLRLLAGVDLHPGDLAPAAVGLAHRHVDHPPHHRGDVDADAVALDERHDGIVRDRQAEVAVDPDGFALGGDFDLVVSGWCHDRLFSIRSLIA
jgi:hypothetical protein